MIADTCDFSDYYNFVVYWTGTKQAPRQYNNWYEVVNIRNYETPTNV